jgi:malate/lactate dehydrogenase
MRIAYRELGVDPKRLIGSAAEAMASAARALTGARSGTSPADVSVPILGIPERWVFGWSDARIGLGPVTARLTPVALTKIEAHVAASWPPGPYALGSAAASVIRTIAHGRLRQLTVFTPVEHALDIRRAIVAVPVSLDASGVRAVQWPALSARERVVLDGALSG